MAFTTSALLRLAYCSDWLFNYSEDSLFLLLETASDCRDLLTETVWFILNFWACLSRECEEKWVWKVLNRTLLLFLAPCRSSDTFVRLASLGLAVYSIS
jgi:hypothetical protein